jgi:hypothetical protein
MTLATRTKAFGTGLLLAAASGTISCGGEPSSDPGEELGTTQLALGSSDPAPTMIRTLAELRTMRLDGWYKLANDIDASATATTPFVPIGGPFNPFRGTFDGASFKINKLRIVGNQYTGLFAWLGRAIVKKLVLTDVNVTGGHNTGAIAGYIDGSELTDSSVSGTVTGTESGELAQVGMAIGMAGRHARIRRCTATGMVTGKAKRIGGFIGGISAPGFMVGDDDPRTRVEEVFTNVNVNPTLSEIVGNVLAGGLVGHVTGGSIENINVFGNVLGRGYAGGIIGYAVNDNPNATPTSLRSGVYNGSVTVDGTPQRAGTVGYYTAGFGTCRAFWNSTTDTGTIAPTPVVDPDCQRSRTRSELRAPHPAPNQVITPFTNGQVDPVTGCGSDGDWGFGSCNGNPLIWALNSDQEYITLVNIPRAGDQPR